MNLYGLFILDANIKYIVFSILYRHVNVPVACKETSEIILLRQLESPLKSLLICTQLCILWCCMGLKLLEVTLHGLK